MNYLAHLFLAAGTAESRIGNLAGDFVKGRLDDHLPPAIRAGIVEHRKIDAFTDAHPEVAAFRRVLVPEYGHYARIISDVFLDHFLATDWNRYAGELLETFLAGVWAQIDPHAASLPGRLRFVYPRMRDEQWLLSYREIEGIHMALTNLAFRLSRRPNLAPAVRHLRDSRGVLSHHFHAFFPDAVAYSLRLRR